MYTLNIAVTVVLLVISVSACCLRVWIRVIKAKHHKPMEYTLICAVLIQIVLTGLTIRMYRLHQTLGQNPLNVVEIGKVDRCPLATAVLLQRNLIFSADVLCGRLPLPWRSLKFCILPFPALAKVSERRLRIAVYMVYSLGLISIAVTIARIVLLATDARHSTEKIMLLSQVEVTTCIVIGVLPGVSSAFTRKYIYGSFSSAHVARHSDAGRINSRHHHGPKKPNTADFIELPSRTPRATFFTERDDSGSLAGSTVEIIQTPANNVDNENRATVYDGTF
ncbi:hypothetical protein BKA56DRAFT_678849 [Ilyonectria sp. MPI-CAGE-AT-0026]|nr:hypothetical protein BKA56DRAFT_678849 [Ilyonectria sp. MPI-CAGE-AT-0026]